MTSSVRVLIADDDPLFMDALEAILGTESEIEAPAEPTTGRRRRGSRGSSTPTSSSWI
jgi:DNA-binding NarL/FixJ family response regulator